MPLGSAASLRDGSVKALTTVMRCQPICTCDQRDVSPQPQNPPPPLQGCKSTSAKQAFRQECRDTLVKRVANRTCTTVSLASLANPPRVKATCLVDEGEVGPERMVTFGGRAAQNWGIVLTLSKHCKTRPHRWPKRRVCGRSVASVVGDSLGTACARSVSIRDSGSRQCAQLLAGANMTSACTAQVKKSWRALNPWQRPQACYRVRAPAPGTRENAENLYPRQRRAKRFGTLLASHSSRRRATHSLRP